MSTVKKESRDLDQFEQERQDRIARMPTLEQCFNLINFEAAARYVMKKKAWAYDSSGADDEIESSDYGLVLTEFIKTMRENHSAFHRIWFRPRVLVDIEKVNFATTMLPYGLPGIDRLMQLLKDEMENNMRLIGCLRIDQLNPMLIDTRGLAMHTSAIPPDTLGLSVYDPFVPSKEKAKL